MGLGVSPRSGLRAAARTEDAGGLSHTRQPLFSVGDRPLPSPRLAGAGAHLDSIAFQRVGLLPQAGRKRAEFGVGDDLAACTVLGDLFSAIGGVFKPGGFLAHLAGAVDHLFRALGHLAAGILTRNGGLLAGHGGLFAGDHGLGAGLFRLGAGHLGLLTGDAGLGAGAVDFGALLGRSLTV